ncbi:MAG: response regulator [Leptospiraceae bacterium]|nr:response regulator [Leptospiraceae bacterium]
MNTTQKTILIVEDEPSIAETEKAFLEGCGDYFVLVAYCCEDTFHLVKSNSIDLILMDIDLKDNLDGTELAELILKEHNLPILFLSSHSNSVIKDKAKKVSGYGFIPKSVDQQTLDTSIELALNLFAEKKDVRNFPVD